MCRNSPLISRVKTSAKETIICQLVIQKIGKKSSEFELIHLKISCTNFNYGQFAVAAMAVNRKANFICKRVGYFSGYQ